MEREGGAFKDDFGVQSAFWRSASVLAVLPKAMP
jgi:hypothetical protein